jgi:arylsulfatase
LAAAGEPDIIDKLKHGHTVDLRGEDKTFTVHIDGYNLLPYLTGEVEASPRRGFFYFSDDGDLVAMRFENWKIVFLEQRCQGTMRIWAEPFTPLRVPKLFNLRTDPFEYADLTSNTYYDWFLHHDYFVFYATAMATKFLETFEEFPPRHPPASFTIDHAVEKLHAFLAKD